MSPLVLYRPFELSQSGGMGRKLCRYESRNYDVHSCKNFCPYRLDQLISNGQWMADNNNAMIIYNLYFVSNPGTQCCVTSRKRRTPTECPSWGLAPEGKMFLQDWNFTSREIFRLARCLFRSTTGCLSWCDPADMGSRSCQYQTQYRNTVVLARLSAYIHLISWVQMARRGP